MDGTRRAAGAPGAPGRAGRGRAEGAGLRLSCLPAGWRWLRDGRPAGAFRSVAGAGPAGLPGRRGRAGARAGGPGRAAVAGRPGQGGPAQPEPDRAQPAHRPGRARPAGGDRAGRPPLLLADRRTLRWNPTRTPKSDVGTLLAHLEAVAAHRHPGPAGLAGCPACLGRLREAADAYRGPFLDAFAGPPSDLFESGRRSSGSGCGAGWPGPWSRPGRGPPGAGRSAAAAGYARRELALEPLAEGAHRRLMGALRRGRRTAHPHPVRGLRAPPGSATRRRAVAGDGGPQRRASAPTRAGRPAPAPAPPDGGDGGDGGSLPDWGEMPAPGALLGREAKLGRLERWLADDGCRLVAVHGLGGVGKTALVAQAAARLAPRFERVVWRSLVNAPPFRPLLGACLRALSGPPGRPRREAAGAWPAHLLDELLDALRRAALPAGAGQLGERPRPGGRGGRGGGGDGGAAGDRGGAATGGPTGRATRPTGASWSWSGRGGAPDRLVLTGRERPREARPPGGGGGGAGAGPGPGRPGPGRGGASSWPPGTWPPPGRSGAASRPATRANRWRCAWWPRPSRRASEQRGRPFLREAPVFDGVRAVLDSGSPGSPGWSGTCCAGWPWRGSPWACRPCARRWRPRPARGPWWRPCARCAATPCWSPPGPRRRTRGPPARGARSRSRGRSTAGPAFGLPNVVTEYLTDRLVDEASRELERGRPGPRAPGAPGAPGAPPSAAGPGAGLRAPHARPACSWGRSRRGWSPGSGAPGPPARLRRLLGGLRARAPRAPGYAAGTVLNLLLHLGADLRGADLAGLSVWQADLRGRARPGSASPGPTWRGAPSATPSASATPWPSARTGRSWPGAPRTTRCTLAGGGRAVPPPPAGPRGVRRGGGLRSGRGDPGQRGGAEGAVCLWDAPRGAPGAGGLEASRGGGEPGGRGGGGGARPGCAATAGCRRGFQPGRGAPGQRRRRRPGAPVGRPHGAPLRTLAGHAGDDGPGPCWPHPDGPWLRLRDLTAALGLGTPSASWRAAGRRQGRPQSPETMAFAVAFGLAGDGHQGRAPWASGRRRSPVGARAGAPRAEGPPGVWRVAPPPPASWPAPARTARCACGSRPPGAPCARSGGTPTRSSGWPSARTGGRWPAPAGTRRCACGTLPPGPAGHAAGGGPLRRDGPHRRDGDHRRPAGDAQGPGGGRARAVAPPRRRGCRGRGVGARGRRAARRPARRVRRRRGAAPASWPPP